MTRTEKEKIGDEIRILQHKRDEARNVYGLTEFSLSLQKDIDALLIKLTEKQS